MLLSQYTSAVKSYNWEIAANIDKHEAFTWTNEALFNTIQVVI